MLLLPPSLCLLAYPHTHSHTHVFRTQIHFIWGIISICYLNSTFLVPKPHVFCANCDAITFTESYSIAIFNKSICFVSHSQCASIGFLSVELWQRWQILILIGHGIFIFYLIMGWEATVWCCIFNFTNESMITTVSIWNIAKTVNLDYRILIETKVMIQCVHHFFCIQKHILCINYEFDEHKLPHKWANNTVCNVNFMNNEKMQTHTHTHTLCAVAVIQFFFNFSPIFWCFLFKL